MNDIYTQKRSFRKHVKQLKAAIPGEEKQERSMELFAQLERYPVFQQATLLMAYWSMPDEVYTHAFVERWYKHKTILLPVVKGDVLELRQFEGKARMKPGDRYGIPEPVGASFTRLEELELIIVPGVAFDEQYNRLGRGKAYYDGLLKNTDAFKVGVCFQEQFFSEVPHDENDVKMDLVITG